MTRLPRDISVETLAKSLRRLGYEVTRQTGSHIRLTTTRGGQHHVTIPAHDPLRVSTLSEVLKDVAEHFEMSQGDLVELLFG